MTVINLKTVMTQIASMTPIAQGAHSLVIQLILSPVMVIAFLRMESAVTLGTAVTAPQKTPNAAQMAAARQAMNAAARNAAGLARNVWEGNVSLLHNAHRRIILLILSPVKVFACLRVPAVVTMGLAGAPQMHPNAAHLLAARLILNAVAINAAPTGINVKGVHVFLNNTEWLNSWGSSDDDTF